MEFRRHLETMDISDGLNQRMKLFERTGRVLGRNDELLAGSSWIHVLLGQGIVHQSYHAIAEPRSEIDVHNFLNRLRDNVQQIAAWLLPHTDYLKRYRLSQLTAWLQIFKCETKYS